MHASGCTVYAAVDDAATFYIYLFYTFCRRVSLYFSPPGRATHRAVVSLLHQCIFCRNYLLLSVMCRESMFWRPFNVVNSVYVYICYFLFFVQ